MMDTCVKREAEIPKRIDAMDKAVTRIEGTWEAFYNILKPILAMQPPPQSCDMPKIGIAPAVTPLGQNMWEIENRISKLECKMKDLMGLIEL